MSEFKYEITRRISTLSSNKSGSIALEVNMISFNGTEPKLDIRKWDKLNDKMLKGISLTADEWHKLKDILNEMAEKE